MALKLYQTAKQGRRPFTQQERDIVWATIRKIGSKWSLEEINGSKPGLEEAISECFDLSLGRYRGSKIRISYLKECTLTTIIDRNRRGVKWEIWHKNG